MDTTLTKSKPLSADNLPRWYYKAETETYREVQAESAELRRRGLATTPIASNPLDWARTNAKLVHPVQGVIPFAPYSYQTEFLSAWQESRRIVVKARQVGYSQAFALEALYTALHVPNSTVLLVSR